MTLGADAGRRHVPGVRVVMDVRALQEPSRAPRTAAYLEGLLSAFDGEPLAGESFAFLMASDEDDPTERFPRLDVIGRRLLPPTRLLRSAALTVDPFLLRGASLGAAWRAEEQGAAGGVYHTAGGGLPIASRLPTVVTLLDLAPWEQPRAFQRSVAARFGQRLRAQLVRDAAAVLVATDAVGRSARRLLHVHRDRIHVVPLAPRAAYAVGPEVLAARGEAARATATGLGLRDRYLVYPGRHDVRQDAATLLAALARLARADRPNEVGEADWPPRVLVLDTTPDDRASLARLAARLGAGDRLVYAPALPSDEAAAVVAAARAVVLPMISESTGLAALDAIAAGVPVVASSVGALPEVVGAAGILVEPRDPVRLATALATAWTDGPVWDGIREAARERALGTSEPLRTWADVAADVRSIYAEAARRG